MSNRKRHQGNRVSVGVRKERERERGGGRWGRVHNIIGDDSSVCNLLMKCDKV